MASIPVHEVFGPTVQGEGYWSGAVVDFIRLAGCPVGCPWCDTGYSDGGMGLPRQEMDISELVAGVKSPRVVISGGEPFIHKALPELVAALLEEGYLVHVETSGAFWQELPEDVWITLSPKGHLNAKYPVASEFWSRANEFKLVVQDGSELIHYLLIMNEFDGPIYLQPEWEQVDRSLPLVLGLLKENSEYFLSLQMHKYIGVQ